MRSALRVRGPWRDAIACEEGSILPLVLGLVGLLLVLLLTTANVTSLFLAQKRLDALADAAALAASDAVVLRIERGEAQLTLSREDVVRAARSYLEERTGVELVSATAPDGRSARVTLAVAWEPIFAGPLLPFAARLEATATSRTALDHGSG